MTMNELLIKVLETRYNGLLNEYTFQLHNGDPEQDRVVEEMESIALELDLLKSGPDTLSVDREFNWGQDALDRLDLGMWN
jgi:hypothetical protein